MFKLKLVKRKDHQDRRLFLSFDRIAKIRSAFAILLANYQL